MDKKSWHQEIDFHCSFGVWPFKKPLTSPRPVFVLRRTVPPQDDNAASLGRGPEAGRPPSQGEVPGYLRYRDPRITIKTKQNDFYEHLTQRFWRSVGKRLMAEMLEGLRKGRAYRFGDLRWATRASQ